MKEAGEVLLSAVLWINRSLSRDMVGSAHRFWWSCFSILHSISVFLLGCNRSEHGLWSVQQRACQLNAICRPFISSVIFIIYEVAISLFASY